MSNTKSKKRADGSSVAKKQPARAARAKREVQEAAQPRGPRPPRSAPGVPADLEDERPTFARDVARAGLEDGLASAAIEAPARKSRGKLKQFSLEMKEIVPGVKFTVSKAVHLTFFAAYHKARVGQSVIGQVLGADSQEDAFALVYRRLKLLDDLEGVPPVGADHADTEAVLKAIKELRALKGTANDPLAKLGHPDALPPDETGGEDEEEE